MYVNQPAFLGWNRLAGASKQDVPANGIQLCCLITVGFSDCRSSEADYCRSRHTQNMPWVNNRRCSWTGSQLPVCGSSGYTSGRYGAIFVIPTLVSKVVNSFHTVRAIYHHSSARTTGYGAKMGVPHVLIIGAGTGGLALAQGLIKHGIATVAVYERDRSRVDGLQGYR